MGELVSPDPSDPDRDTSQTSFLSDTVPCMYNCRTFFLWKLWQLMVPRGRPRLPITKSLPLGVLEEKRRFLSSEILCSSLECVNTPDERWNGGESKLGSLQVSAVDGSHRAKQLKHEDHKMMRQLFMQGTVMPHFSECRSQCGSLQVENCMERGGAPAPALSWIILTKSYPPCSASNRFRFRKKT